MIVAVVGSRGFIGTPLARRLEAAGLDVRRLDRSDSWDGGRYDLAWTDAPWSTGLRGVEVVINAAGMAHDIRTLTPDQVAQYQAVNADGVGRLAGAAAEMGVKRLIHLSTIKVLGEQPSSGERFSEADALAPVGHYAQTKADGEKQALAQLQDSDTAATILRLPLVFGTPFKGNLATLASAIRRGVPLPLGHRDIGKRTYVMMPDLLDVVQRILKADRDLPPVLHARSAPDLTAAEVAQLVGDDLNRQPRIVSVAPAVMRSTARLLGKPEAAAKICDPMLVSDDLTRIALGLSPH